jgi:hypothetical protein
MEQEKVICNTPTPGKQPTRIDKWKYDVVAKAILNALPRKGKGLLFSELPDRVKARLTKNELQRLGSISWYTTTVKLDLEVKGKIERVEGENPQRLIGC